MKIEQLQQFLMVVEKGSMNEAANELFIARSALSASMKKLEAEMGEQLFIRNARGVNLTPFGSHVYQQALEICSRVDFLHDIAQNRARNTLNISTMYCSIANVAFYELLRRHGPSELINASIEEDSLNSVMERVRDGLADIGIVSLLPGSEVIARRKMENMDIEYTELAQRRLGAFVGPQNPLFETDAEDVTQAELMRYPHLENYSVLEDHSWEHHFPPENGRSSKLLVSDLAVSLRLVSETSTIMVDTDDSDIYRKFYNCRKLRFLPIRDYPKCQIGWIRLKHMEISPAAREFLDIMSGYTSLAR